jgi:hypothetical protein
MSTMADALRIEASNIASKTNGLDDRAVTEATEEILSTAEAIIENAGIHGDKAVGLLKKCEDQMRTLVKANAQNRGHRAALPALSSRVAADASPDDVRKAFLAATKELTQSDDGALEESFEPLTKLRKLVRESGVGAARGRGGAGSGAGPSGASREGDDDDELGDDGMVMTQAQRSTRCPLLQMDMTATGELRPMKTPCGHCFSHKGIADLLKRKSSVACPQAGCKAPAFSMGQLVDDKDMVKQIKKSLARN